ncbi:hypothetical protein [Nocardioides sp.]|uniref:hypothetical protein n=1 Tax=Nocardioides sp. TaxID=35761 RepID=UPI0037839ADC
MPTQSFSTVDVLRLEVETDPTGLYNLVANPMGELGGWGWITPVAGTTMTKSKVTSGWRLRYNHTIGANYFYTEPMPVTAGEYVAAYAEGGSGGTGYVRLRFEWLNSAGAVITASTQSGYYFVNGTVMSVGAVQAPTGTVYARLRFDQYLNTSGANMVSGGYITFTKVTVAKSATLGALTGLGYLDPIPYQNILGPTHDLSINRDELNVGLLTASVLDASLDPAVATLLRPGRKARVMTLDGTTWTPIFWGAIRNAAVTYDYARTDAKRARITLTAVDNVSRLASIPATDGVAQISELPWILEGAGVPWSCNGSGSQVASATVVAHNENASVLDQIAITRDTISGYAWVDRFGVMQAWDASQIPTTVAATLDEDDYSSLVVDYDTDRCINTVTIKYLRINLATGETVEIPYGPYTDATSVATWGPHAAEFTVQGGTESSAAMAAYGAAVLAANATPVIRVQSTTLPIAGVGDLPKALLDLYDLVTVNNTNGGLSDSLRVTSIQHTITSEKWLTTLGFAVDGGVAPPVNTPSPGNGAVAPGIQHGSTTMSGSSIAAGASVTATVSFTVPYSATPAAVYAQVAGFVSGAGLIAIRQVDQITATDFRIVLVNLGSGAATFTNLPIRWTAFS